MFSFAHYRRVHLQSGCLINNIWGLGVSQWPNSFLQNLIFVQVLHQTITRRFVLCPCLLAKTEAEALVWAICKQIFLLMSQVALTWVAFEHLLFIFPIIVLDVQYKSCRHLEIIWMMFCSWHAWLKLPGGITTPGWILLGRVHRCVHA